MKGSVPFLRILAVSMFLQMASGPALADTDLHEGTHTSVGATATLRESRYQVSGSADFSLVPAPGGLKLNGSQVMVKAGIASTGVRPDLDAARAQLLRWGHLRAIGVERDRFQASPFSFELGALLLPFYAKGKVGDRNWAIAHAGAGIGYKAVTEALGGQVDVKGAAATLSCRIDTQSEITDRLQLRAFGEVLYTALVGGGSGQSGAAFKHQLQASGGVGLWYDLSSEDPYRLVPRTHPATGVKTFRKIANEGKRYRLGLVDIQGFMRPMDTLTKTQAGITIQSGMAVDF